MNPETAEFVADSKSSSYFWNLRIGFKRSVVFLNWYILPLTKIWSKFLSNNKKILINLIMLYKNAVVNLNYL